MAPSTPNRKAHCADHPIPSQREIDRIIKSVIKAAKRHKFDATKDWRRRFYKAIGKKEDAEFARRPELTFWMACCAMNYDEDPGSRRHWSLSVTALPQIIHKQLAIHDQKD
ncbi:hypothetical protein HO133_006550 [Letharia lupina]|uniref:Uncharacterized protein n=1 Tax=Letharia lupina TaxID=560253 RepID=A0A8H6C641_9LECA|nr:uncharacterized protein HO133_006550 [Letharia lupina]KAF6217723.1 hypothetical protein HO133_006550 [Letharia lupina]